MQHIISYYNEVNEEQFLTNFKQKKNKLRDIQSSNSINKAKNVRKEEVIREIRTTRKPLLTTREKKT